MLIEELEDEESNYLTYEVEEIDDGVVILVAESLPLAATL